MNSFLGNSPLQAALRSGKTPDDLARELGLNIRRHPRYSNLVLFNYDQIKSPKTDPIVCCARGCILDEADNWAYVCRPFDRFFNLGEAQNVAVPPDPADPNTRVYTKEDGSLLNMWWYQAPGEADGAWHVSTRTSPDASGTVGDFGFTLAELFWRVYGDRRKPPSLGVTFMFELCTRFNRILVPYPEDKLVLLGMRDHRTGIERVDWLRCWCDGLVAPNSRIDILGRGNESPKLETPQAHTLTSFADMQASFSNLPARLNEGYVVAQYMADGSVRRCKVKHPGYVALAHIGEGGVTRRRILELIRNGEDGEFLSSYPEYADLFNELRPRYADFVEHIKETWARIGQISEQKAFALEAAKCRAPGVLFSLRRGRLLLESLLGMDVAKLLQLLDEKGTK